ncbi:MAG: hypothetical protein UV79_C0008G0007 [candidate division TM6 bacterium GW2011_GWF2_43_17]|nr:MAG: hypothetical protein UV79_C0008G0007 [candidate division TM6 bacterium GW2011_GWF2_43_17]HAU30105.1 hypothetical protein [Candidatus Dependentiae bacterium]
MRMNATQLLSSGVAYACTRWYVWLFAFFGAFFWVLMMPLYRFLPPYAYYLLYESVNIFWYVALTRWVIADERTDLVDVRQMLWESLDAYRRLWWLVLLMAFWFGSFWTILDAPESLFSQNIDLLLLLILGGCILFSYGLNFFLIPAVVYDQEEHSVSRVITRALDLFTRYFTRLNYLFWLVLLVGTVVFAVVVLVSLLIRPITEFIVAWGWSQELYSNSVVLFTCSVVMMLVGIIQGQFWHLLETKYRI